jgi:hypothetical protein
MVWAQSAAKESGAKESGAKESGAKDSGAGDSLWAQENLMAWCIVPFDGKRRNPEQRAAMERLLEIANARLNQLKAAEDE